VIKNLKTFKNSELNRTKIKQIDARQLKETDLILDIRSHIRHSKIALKYPHWHVEADDVNPKEFIRQYHLDGSKTLYILCTTGEKSRQMAQKFIEADYPNVAILTGGIIQAKTSGLRMIEHHYWNMQQQKDLIVGIIILTGFVLCFLMSMIFLILPVMIGFILIIQGILGQNQIEKMLMKCPWNK